MGDGPWKLVWSMRKGAGWKEPGDNAFYEARLTTAHDIRPITGEPPEREIALPMERPGLFGTEADGPPSSDYCEYCYQNADFTEPDITMQQMIDRCVKHMVQQNAMPSARARPLLTKCLPRLKRWKTD